ncbi:amidohydrolase [Aquipseudomonas alcaligenes]|uniref:amidohydrolase n=1 Tax=Aquipseudomonas alcaligenes TaxID=43263 RepID=UPI00078003F1|nr:amidohydrolase [Pseudomonas alcaligenes]AMR67453.1 amidohydrolase [Pseudomonas alcaligenes]
MKLTAKAIGCAILTSAVTHYVIAQEQSGAVTTADAIYSGGEIITVNELQPEAEAIAVKDGRILAVGYRDEVMKLKGAKTQLVDLAGSTLVPGFIDPHGHVFNTGIQAISANLLPRPDGGVNNIPELQAALKGWAGQSLKLTDKYGWIVGFGYDDAQLKEQRHPTRDDLDQVSTELPVVIVHQSGHLGVMNSKALAILGLNAGTKNPPGGVIRRKQGTQEPDGVLEENAFFAQLFGLMGKLSPDANKALFAAGVSLYKSFGYTTAQEGKASLDSVATMEAVAKSGKLDIDVVAYPDITVGIDAMKAPWLSRSYADHFRIGGIKLTLDGSPQGKTAWLSKPYFKVPAGQPADYHGYSAFTDQQVNGFVDQAFKNNWQVLAHVNGDAAIDQYLNAVRAAEKKYGMADRRPVAIHAQTARLDQVEAFKELGIIPSFFPMHTFYWGDWHRDSVLGADRATNISPTGWAIERNMIFTSHHDAPVAMPDAMRVISSTVNRVTRSGQVLGPEHRTTPLVALKAHTLWSAYQHFEEKEKGSLEVGKLADFVVLDANPLTVEPLKIADIKVLETIKEGKSVYRRDKAVAQAGVLESCAASDACFIVASRALGHAGLVHAHH